MHNYFISRVNCSDGIHPDSVFVFFLDDDNIIRVGWSKCKTTGLKKDVFSKEKGMKQAINRAYDCHDYTFMTSDFNLPKDSKIMNIPESISVQFYEFCRHSWGKFSELEESLELPRWLRLIQPTFIETYLKDTEE